MKLSPYLSGFVLGMITAIDTRRHQDVSVAEVEEHIEKGDLISYLKDRLARDIDLSLYSPKIAQEINEKMRYMLTGCKGSERRKWGIENSGLCLLAAWGTKLLEEEKH